MPENIPAMSGFAEFEGMLLVARHALERWMTHAMAQAGCAGLAALDALVLQLLFHSGAEQSLAELGLLAGVDEPHVLRYALKKLGGLALVQAMRRGRESYYTVTDSGRALCGRYLALRDALVVDEVGRALGAGKGGGREAAGGKS